MLKLVPNKPVLILLYGYPGSGKTYFARELCQQFSAAHIQDGRIRSELFEQPGYTKEENHVVSSLMNYMAAEFLNAGMSVVYDANVQRIAQRKALSNMAARLHADTLVVWMQLDEETAFERVNKRDRRKVDDRYSPSIDRTTFEQFSTGMQNPDPKEQYIVISGKHASSSQRNSVLRRLQELGIVSKSDSHVQVVKPGLVNLVPNPMAGRVDMTRRNVTIR